MFTYVTGAVTLNIASGLNTENLLEADIALIDAALDQVCEMRLKSTAAWEYSFNGGPLLSVAANQAIVFPIVNGHDPAKAGANAIKIKNATAAIGVLCMGSAAGNGAV